MISTFVAALAIILAAHGAWILLRNPKEWPIPLRNAYAACVLLAAMGALLWVAGYGSGNASVTGLLGTLLAVTGCAGASFISRRANRS